MVGRFYFLFSQVKRQNQSSVFLTNNLYPRGRQIFSFRQIHFSLEVVKADNCPPGLGSAKGFGPIGAFFQPLSLDVFIEGSGCHFALDE